MRSGQKVRDYILEERIGAGGMGEVWRALHTGLQRKMALKVMDARIADDPEFEQRFIHEARAQAALQHSQIVPVTDFFSEDGVYYLVMPLVDGLSLEDRLAKGLKPLPLEEALEIARDLLEALDYAHRRGVIHRDIKPSNILLDASGHAHVLDFGIALMVGQDRRTRTGASLGTPHYMSPEQIKRPQSIDHRADVYSAGCVIYEMLAGRPPFRFSEDDTDTPFVVQQAHVEQAPDPIRTWNPAVPPEIERAVLHALAKEPDKRWNGCGEFLQALKTRPSKTVFEDPPKLEPQASNPLPLSPHQSRSSRAWILGSIFGCLALGTLMVVLIAGKDRTDEADLSSDAAEIASRPPEPTASQASADFSKVLRGEVGKFEVEIRLTRSGEKLRGVYTYPPRNRTTSLSGTVDGQGRFTINEYFEGKKHTGIYRGSFTASSSTELQGVWSDPKSPLSLSFHLEEAGN